MKLGTMGGRFSPARAALLVRNRALEDGPGLGIGLGIVLGANVLSLVVSHRAFLNSAGGQGWSTAIVLAGLILSAYAFKGMHDGKAGSDWILLPATPLEKYLAALLSYLVLYPFLAAAAATGASALLHLAESLAGGPGGRIWTPFQAGILEDYADYAVASLVFIAGSASFRKRAPLKTIGAVTAYGLALASLFLGGLALLHAGRGDLDFRYMNGIFSAEGGIDSDRIERIGKFLFEGIRLVLAPLFALLYGYFRVFEKEARDEVQ